MNRRANCSRTSAETTCATQAMSWSLSLLPVAMTAGSGRAALENSLTSVDLENGQIDLKLVSNSIEVRKRFSTALVYSTTEPQCSSQKRQHKHLRTELREITEHAPHTHMDDTVHAHTHIHTHTLSSYPAWSPPDKCRPNSNSRMHCKKESKIC